MHIITMNILIFAKIKVVKKFYICINVNQYIVM